MSTETAPARPLPAAGRPRNLPLDAVDAFGEAAALAACLGVELDAVPARLWDSALLDPARAFLARPGKAFRARLVELGWALAGGEGPCPAALMQIVELLHAGSLIVDDIQDASEERRGGPTLHRTHGLPVALNTGNWMYFVALEQIDGLTVDGRVIDGETRRRLYRAAVRTMTRCHHGQALDLSVHIGLLAHHEVPGVVATTTLLKTGALMGWAAASAAIVAGADEARVEAIARFGEALGAGLQMLDDLSGLLNPHRRHKGLEDLRGARPTWAWAWLAEAVDEVTFVRLQHRARDVLDGAAPEALADALAARVDRAAREQIAAHLDRTFTDLHRAVGDHPALDGCRSEIDRLSVSYI